MYEDWDNLLILDACRYDLFRDHHNLPGRLEKQRSMASSTVDFLRTNFDGEDLRDTVYITANGQIQNFSEQVDAEFYDVVPLYAEAWNDELGTVPPDAVSDAALKAVSEYPNKRLLIHYVQPHFPFIGSELEEDKRRISDGERPFWLRVFCDDMDLTGEQLWDAYRATFQMMLPEVERAMDALPGKTVVTSDHGNMFGERARPIPIREWGHPSGIDSPKLLEVPWLVYENGSRKKIIAESPREQELKLDPSVVNERLADLGYK
ncbi:alkaline phosphatase family protein [Salinigranum halophilum]|uniref:hypothetical protein n=1 Tax=Salinigranum halophilum TaxID=2565931 RepID=UPI0010A83B48|nr:hypothetical protein [Salinigranum halophilum]